jgi:hypothetical protein
VDFHHILLAGLPAHSLAFASRYTICAATRPGHLMVAS